jgi:signal transduction histidine kinase
VDSLDQDIAAAVRMSWLVVGIVTVLMYLLIAGFVRYASDTIQHQQNELGTQVLQLRAVVKQNEQLHQRVRRAARRTTALNERFLRRISAELHDGPAQDLGFALLRLDHLMPRPELVSAGRVPDARAQDARVQDAPIQSDFQMVTNSLHHALQEIRAISAGMGLPELENLSLAETAVRAVRAHERRTGTRVSLQFNSMPEHAPLPVKITAYRIIQEALSNAYRHANGLDQQVRADYARNQLTLTIADGGPGFDETRAAQWDEHMGLAGMRERVESLGGVFHVESARNQGTRVIAQLPLDGN